MFYINSKFYPAVTAIVKAPKELVHSSLLEQHFRGLIETSWPLEQYTNTHWSNVLGQTADVKLHTYCINPSVWV